MFTCLLLVCFGLEYDTAAQSTMILRHRAQATIQLTSRREIDDGVSSLGQHSAQNSNPKRLTTLEWDSTVNYLPPGSPSLPSGRQTPTLLFGVQPEVPTQSARVWQPGDETRPSTTFLHEVTFCCFRVKVNFSVEKLKT